MKESIYWKHFGVKLSLPFNCRLLKNAPSEFKRTIKGEKRRKTLGASQSWIQARKQFPRNFAAAALCREELERTSAFQDQVVATGY